MITRLTLALIALLLLLATWRALQPPAVHLLCAENGRVCYVSDRGIDCPR